MVLACRKIEQFEFPVIWLPLSHTSGRYSGSKSFSWPSQIGSFVYGGRCLVHFVMSMLAAEKLNMDSCLACCTSTEGAVRPEVAVCGC